MSVMYSNALKKKICHEICLNGKSTIKTANEYNVPLKTLEKWITAFNKDSHCFDSENFYNDFTLLEPVGKSNLYDDMSNNELKNELLKKDIELARLKKGYLVKGVGQENKVFVTFSKKNTK